MAPRVLACWAVGTLLAFLFELISSGFAHTDIGVLAFFLDFPGVVCASFILDWISRPRYLGSHMTLFSMLVVLFAGLFYGAILFCIATVAARFKERNA